MRATGQHKVAMEHVLAEWTAAASGDSWPAQVCPMASLLTPSGQVVLVNVAPLRLIALDRSVFNRLASSKTVPANESPARSAPFRYAGWPAAPTRAVRRSTSDRLAPDKLAPDRFAPYKEPPTRSVPHKLAFVRVVLLRFAPVRFAPFKFAPGKDHPVRFLPDRLQPCRSALLVPEGGTTHSPPLAALIAALTCARVYVLFVAYHEILIAPAVQEGEVVPTLLSAPVLRQA